MVLPILTVGILASTVGPAHGDLADSIPYFARKYGVSCGECHVAPPKLNAAGQEFVNRGYRRGQGSARRTWPFALWLSGRTESVPATATVSEEAVSYLNRVELISGGPLTPWLSYFVEWRALSKEARGNGTLRDRSGRFEDLFLTAGGERIEVMAGQFRQLAQVDVSQRLGINEPLLLSASLAGRAGGSAREQSLRGFAPAARSPSIRVAWRQAVGSGTTWTTSAALPLPGEFSIPLSDSARVEASNEIEWDAKGVIVESFVRRGLLSLGGHVFYDNAERYLVNVLATTSHGPLHTTGMLGVTKRAAPGRSERDLFGQWSAQAEYAPHRLFAVGGRAEDRAADGAGPAFLPYVNVHFPGTTYTLRLTVEQRFQRSREAIFVELATIF
jgi:hypothetical protein